MNRKNASASFKAITRQKRDHVPDGKGLKWEQPPPIGHYTAKYSCVHKQEQIPIIRSETSIEKEITKIQVQEDGGEICGKVL